MMKTDTSLSRRRLLASMPAAAAAMAPAAATALCRFPGNEDDPVFAVIERHRQAFEAYREADAVHQQLRDEHEAQQNPDGIYLGERPEIKYQWIKEGISGGSEKESQAFHEIPTGRMVPCYATCPADIDNNVPAGCADPDAWKAQKHRELDEWFGCFDGSPISVAYHAWNAADRRLIEATAELNVRPTTMAGVAALLRYIAGFHDDDVWTDVIYEEDDEDCERPPRIDNDGLFKDVLENLAEAAESIRT